MSTASAKPPAPSMIRALLDDENVKSFLARQTSKSLLEIAFPREVPQARLLQWAFDPGHSHELGDAAIKAVLLSASRERDAQSALLRRLATHSWKQAVVCREYPIGGRRCDLVIANPKQKGLIAIEFKAGARLTDRQLKDYASGLRREFKGWALVCLLIDAESKNHEEAIDHGWTPLDLRWLTAFLRDNQPSAKRFDGGAQSLRDLLSYLNRQNSETAAHDRLITKIALQHGRVLRWMSRLSDMGWGDCLRAASADGLRQLDAIYLRNCEAWNEVIDRVDVAGVHRIADDLGMKLEVYRRNLYLYAPEWDELKKDASQMRWPVNIHLSLVDEGSSFKVKPIAALPHLSSRALRKLEASGVKIAQGGVVGQWRSLTKAQSVDLKQLSAYVQSLRSFVSETFSVRAQ